LWKVFYFKSPQIFLQVKLNNFAQDYTPRNKVNISVATGDTNSQLVDRRYVCSGIPYRLTTACAGKQLRLIIYGFLPILKEPLNHPNIILENSSAEGWSG